MTNALCTIRPKLHLHLPSPPLHLPHLLLPQLGHEGVGCGAGGCATPAGSGGAPERGEEGEQEMVLVGALPCRCVMCCCTWHTMAPWHTQLL